MTDAPRFDAYRENVVGRANVEDTPELVRYYKDLEQFEAGALWTVVNKIEPWEPVSASVPVLWRFRDLREHVLRSVALVTPEKAGRRVILVFLNYLWGTVMYAGGGTSSAQWGGGTVGV